MKENEERIIRLRIAKLCQALQKIERLADECCRGRDPGEPLGIEWDVRYIARTVLDEE